MSVKITNRKLLVLLGIIVIVCSILVFNWKVVINIINIMSSEEKLEFVEIDNSNLKDGIDLLMELSSIPNVYKIESCGWFDLKGDGNKEEFYIIFYANKNQIVKYICVVSKRSNSLLFFDFTMGQSQAIVEYFKRGKKPQVLIAINTGSSEQENVSKLALNIYENGKNSEFKRVYSSSTNMSGQVEIKDNEIYIISDEKKYQVYYANGYKTAEQ